MNTFYATAERAEPAAILRDLDAFRSFEKISELVNALPYIAAILNKERQIVYGNIALLEAMGYSDLESILGMRPGEFLKCIHSKENEGGCGTSESCRYCGAVNSILECMQKKEKITSECRITAISNEKEFSYDFSVTAAPFSFKDQDFVVLSLNDISDEKRRLALEHIFFHDIINTAGGLRGFLEFLQSSDDPEESKEFLQIASQLSNNLVDEIMAQIQILAAERGELKTNKKNISALGILLEVKNQMEHHLVAQKKNILIQNITPDQSFNSDPVLLKRVLVNMLKNALEASRENQEIKMGFETTPSHIIFHVHNQTFIPRNIQLQIFQRSFSTKDASRGLGTYSIKLLAEQYLSGKVEFNSEEVSGTVFKIELPL
ncbi:MAG: histidine kinase [Bacteroidetes bacterium HGW-Bacteroidetes-1]|jgi:signal transduction histidine kinase|nr:MAG: histidine kinase [Bacteroidetes bacterium HGW-Bacteroidetes-1]